MRPLQIGYLRMLAQRNGFLLGLGVATAIIPTTILFLCVNLLFFIPLVVGVVVICLGMRKNAKPSIELSARMMVLFAWIGPFLITSYLTRSGPPVEFIVPPGFTGMIEVVRDRKHGEDLRFDQGTYKIVVPSSGVVRLKETDPFHRWHEEWCRDTNGKPKPLESKGTTGVKRKDPDSNTAVSDFEETTYRWETR